MSVAQLNEPADGEGGEWVVVKPDWWRTPFSAVSWTYRPSTKDGSKIPAFAKPPHYHSSLFSPSTSQSSPSVSQNSEASDSATEPLIYGGDIALNSDLIGVKGAGAVVVAYENDVGFHCMPPSSAATSAGDGPGLLRFEADEEDIALNRERWAELVHNITGGLILDDFSTDSDASPTAPCFSDFSPPSSAEGGLHRSTSTLSSIDISEPSQFMPPTPKPRADMPLASTPSRRLNAAASAFVPSSQIPEPSSFPNFVFPSLSKPVPPTVKITKDDQGFVTEVQVESDFSPASPSPSKSASISSSRPSSALLPPFLHEPCHRRKAPSSKTRALVDQLRLMQPRDDSHIRSAVNVNSISLSPSPSPSFDCDFFKPRLAVSEDGGDRDSVISSEVDEDGWIGISESDADPESQTKRKKAKRTRELFLALSRHRGDPVGTAISDDGDERPQAPSPIHSPAPSSNDGWIDGSSLAAPSSPPPPPSKPHRDQPKRATHAGKASVPPHTASSSHPPPPPPPLPTSAPPTITSFGPPLFPPQFPAPPLPPPLIRNYALPIPFVYPAYAAAVPPSYAAYVQMLQLQAQAGAARAAAAAAADWTGVHQRPAPPKATKAPPLHSATKTSIW